MNIHSPLHHPEDPVATAAREYFSIPSLYPVQRYTISNILEGINQIVVLPTGSGKSLCFQLPSLLLPGVTFVIVPLLSLMEDQVRRLDKAGIQSGCIKGGQEEKERDRLMKEILAGKIRVVFITPESLLSKKMGPFFDKIDVQHLVIDEAHCVTEWGDTFRPAYTKIGQFIHTRHPRVVTAFTATASADVIGKMKQVLFDDIPIYTLVENPDRPNIHYQVIPVLSKSRGVIKILEYAERPVIIYTRSRKRTEFYAHLVRKRLTTDKVFFYHAGLDKRERKDVEDWFMKSDNGILTATSAFGLGIDKPDVRTVIHADVPYSTEAYLQESGRAGRDKQQSYAVLLYSDEDMLFADKLCDPVQQSRYEKLLGYVRETGVCRREYLLSLLQYELEGRCAGCDVCEKRVITGKEGEAGIMAFVKKYKRRFSKREMIQILHGKQTYDVMNNDYDRFREFGLLEKWEKKDIEEGINTLLTARKLAVPWKGFWKQKVTLPGSRGSFTRNNREC
jgi:ATP-dependent DNA helicase RecQ